MKQITVNVYKYEELSRDAQHRASLNTIRVAQERARRENALDAVKGLVEATGADEVTVTEDKGKLVVVGVLTGRDTPRTMLARAINERCGVPLRFVYAYYDLLLRFNEVKQENTRHFDIDLGGINGHRVTFPTLPKDEKYKIFAAAPFLEHTATQLIELMNELYATLCNIDFEYGYAEVTQAVYRRVVKNIPPGDMYLADGTLINEERVNDYDN